VPFLFNAIFGAFAKPVLPFTVSPSHCHLEPIPDGFAWTWTPLRLEQPLWTIALDAAELLVMGLASRVRTCPGHDCGWVFLDVGRGKPRRWCAMDLCGNRDKINKFRRRHHPLESHH
jgi:predicted RNA-binding Zn ribbon-like protein